jgi:mRNA-degrading endonuclease RelE of RelBE toxin-antitoxin system
MVKYTVTFSKKATKDIEKLRAYGLSEKLKKWLNSLKGILLNRLTKNYTAIIKERIQDV